MHIRRPGVWRLRLIVLVLLTYVPAATAQKSASETQPAEQQVASTHESSGAGEGGRRTMTALRLADDESIVLDGRLDEPIWSRAVPAAGFIQIDPFNGRPATEPTEVRIVFDGDALYMGVICYDSEPDRWIGYQMRRDEGLGSDDRFMWTIDTFLDGRTGYFFEMNPSGLMADALLGMNGQNREWDGIWNARVRRSEIGWTLEIKIPFRTLNFNPESDGWGINFQRTVRRKGEDSIWTGWARNQELRRMNNAGLVTGIRDVTQGRGLDIKPYGLVTSEASPGRGSTAMTGSASAGVDLFYNPTPLLRANVTVNTDFAQIDVDQRQVNLTRYSLFFPERRDFFLDGAIFFDFGSDTDGDRQGQGGNQRIIPFFSRRIGLSAGGEPERIDFGTKLTGQVGAQDVGLLHVRTGDNDGADTVGEDFTVARIKRRVLEQSYIGALYTRRGARTSGIGPDHTVGADARFATSTFLGDQNLEAGGWVLSSSRPGVSSDRSAFGATVNFPNDRWIARFDAAEVQEHFDPAIGFVTRSSYRRYAPTLDFAPRPSNHPYIRQLTFGGSVDMLTDLENDLLTRTVDLTLIQVNLHSQDNFSVAATNRREWLDEPFGISQGITLPLGAVYDFTRYRVWGQTANRRILAVSGRLEIGDFFSGTRTERVLNLNLRLRPGLFLYLTGQWNNVRLREGSFTTQLYRIVGETQFSPFMSLVHNIQYDTQSAVVGWQSRFRWIVTPGNDVYLVYTHNWLDDPLRNRFSTFDRRFASKVLYTYRF